MSSVSIARFLNPWKHKRETERRVDELRRRDGDDCRRCRKPIRFDLPDGHDRAPTIQSTGSNGSNALDDLCLCHVRCNAAMVDHTPEVIERIRRKNEAALFTKSRGRKKKAA
jgi:hypothetical protein